MGTVPWVHLPSVPMGRHPAFAVLIAVGSHPQACCLWAGCAGDLPATWPLGLGCAPSAPGLALPSRQHRGGCGVSCRRAPHRGWTCCAVPWQSSRSFKGRNNVGKSCWAGQVSQSAMWEVPQWLQSQPCPQAVAKRWVPPPAPGSGRGVRRRGRPGAGSA